MATKRSCGCCCFRFSCFSCLRFSCFSCFRKPDHPTSGPGSQSSPPAIETLPGAQAPIPGPFNVVTPLENEIEHTHPGGKAPVSESPRKSEENVNLNVPEAPQCDEAPSPSTSEVATIRDVIGTILHKDIVQIHGKNEPVDLDLLMNDISKLLKLREKEMSPGKKVSNPKGSCLTNLKDILSLPKLKGILSSPDFTKLTKLVSDGSEAVSKWTQIISGPVTKLLKDVGQVSVFTAGLLLVANTLETFQQVSSNQKECLDLLKEMSCLATIVKRLTERPGEKQEDEIQESVTLIVEGAILCCTNMESPYWKRFFSTSTVKDDLSGMRKKLEDKYRKIDIVIGLRLLTNTERVLAAMAARNPPLSKKYPEHAVGIKESIEEVKKLFECDSEKNVVIVILHGFGGIGKTTLADAVFSKVEGCKYSKVKLFEDIDSKPDIVKLQEKILEDLMVPEESVQIRGYEDGQNKLGEILEKRQAFIYIDNVLGRVQLEHLLPKNLDKAKKVWFLLTARDTNVERAFPSSVSTQIYDMKGIKNPDDARSIFEKENMKGLDSVKLNVIIEKCDGHPLLLKLVARFIGHAGDKGAAYKQLMENEEIWNKA